MTWGHSAHAWQGSLAESELLTKPGLPCRPLIGENGGHSAHAWRVLPVQLPRMAYDAALHRSLMRRYWLPWNLT